MKRPVDPAVKQAVCAALKAGKTKDEIQAVWPVSASAISHWRRDLLRRGLILPLPGGSTPLPQREAGYAALLAGVESRAEIAQRLGVKTHTVQAWAQDLIHAGRMARPLRSRSLAQERGSSVKRQPVPCLACGVTFFYRYTGIFHDDHLTQIERLCPDCFSAFCARQQMPEPSDRRPRHFEDEDEEDDDAEMAD